MWERICQWFKESWEAMAEAAEFTNKFVNGDDYD